MSEAPPIHQIKAVPHYHSINTIGLILSLDSVHIYLSDFLNYILEHSNPGKPCKKANPKNKPRTQLHSVFYFAGFTKVLDDIARSKPRYNQRLISFTTPVLPSTTMEVQQQHQIQVQLTTSRRQPRQRVDAIMSQLNDETSFPSTNRSRRRMSSVSSSRPSLIFPSSSSYLFVLLVLLVQQTKYVVHGQYCVSFNNTWDGLVQTLQDSNGWAILCPFEISGDQCLPNYVGDVPIPPSSGEGGGGGVSLFASTPSSTKTVHSIYDEGYVVGNDENLFLICDPFMYRFDSQSSDCIINCPGRHFTIRPHAKLTLDRMTLNGATDTSIKIQSHGYLNTINTKFQK